MRQTLCVLLLVAATTLLGGCNAVLVDEPFGTPLSEGQAAHYVGAYVGNRGRPLVVRQTGPSSLQAAVIDENERHGFHMLVVDLDLRRWDNNTILFGKINYDASSVDADENEDGVLQKRWGFMYEVNRNAASNPPRPLVFTPPDRAAFDALIQSGELPGREIGRDLLLEPAEKALSEKLRGNLRGAEKLFRFDRPIVFTRLN